MTSAVDPLDLTTAIPTRYAHPLADGRIGCDVCPRHCTLLDGQRGLCFVRARRGDEIVLTTYGRSSGYCVDPIEKKPLYHFLPGTPVLSFGTAGCNLACRFCQNWDISTSREMQTLADSAPPERIARAAQALGCRSVACTYNDPVIFLEYAIDTAKACRELGIRSVAVTAGYVCEEPRVDLFRHMDAANVDLKAFRESFYTKWCRGHLAPVLETLEYLVKETDVWVEVTTLLIPGENDSDEDLHAASAWMVEHLGPDVPWHFTAFHPDYRMRDKPSTPAPTLHRARAIARSHGMRFAYTGNVRDPEGSRTDCPVCEETLVARDGYAITGWKLSADGSCPRCGTACPGVLEARPGTWGSHRLPVRLADFDEGNPSPDAVRFE
jgi:pyruvate formate lyase activating enzyme